MRALGLSPPAPPLSAAAFPAFRARPPWLGGDLQTLRNYLVRPRLDLAAWPAERLSLAMGDGSGDRLVASLHRPAPAAAKPLVVLIHGLTGCADSTYVLATARHLLSLGHPVLRLNLRGAGPSAQTCRMRYHAGRSQDLADALAALDPALNAAGVIAVGYSLGANMLIKHLAEQGAKPGEAGPVIAAASVSAPIDLREAAFRLMAPRNRLYHGFLLKRMKEELVAADDRAARQPDFLARLDTVYAFDQAVVAPENGFASADDYYARSSALGFLPGVKVPTLVIFARNDPWIPAAAYDRFDWRANPHLVPLIVEGGGHVGFHGSGSPIPWHDRCVAELCRLSSDGRPRA